MVTTWFEQKEQSQPIGMLGVPGMEQLGDQMKGAFSKLFPQKTHRKKMKVGAAWRHLIEDESSKLVDEDKITDLARERVEQMGIVFIDEIDKLASGSQQRSADISPGFLLYFHRTPCPPWYCRSRRLSRLRG